jgi:hypothetical protein
MRDLIRGRPPITRLSLGADQHEWEVKDDATGAIATLMVTDDGGPIRPIITGMKSFGTGAYPSFKNHKTVYWEGLTERALVFEAEVYPHITRYDMNRYTLEFPFEGKRVRYTPDQVRHYVDGSIEAIEAKFDHRGFEKAEYDRLLTEVERLLSLVGWRFRRVGLSDVFSSDVFSSDVHAKNVSLVQTCRFVTIAPEHFEIIDEIRRNGEIIVGYRDLAERLEPTRPLYGEAIINGLMVRRHLQIDLKTFLGPDTAVWILPSPVAPAKTLLAA